ncbi:hypothetical protein BGZ61DRAFT_562992, partial [Ilyonectria robusta]|uniref:uncharacterized protein n=1 Tax=Ilyonectria robusta TaxID=1079257 RepID=UPI001E8D0DE6
DTAATIRTPLRTIGATVAKLPAFGGFATVTHIGCISPNGYTGQVSFEACIENRGYVLQVRSVWMRVICATLAIAYCWKV